jgi:hypothetical protein
MPSIRRVTVRFTFLLAVFMAVVAVGEAAAQDARPTRRGRKYRVRIDSAPQQAAVYLDDERYGIVGYTPYSGSLQKGEWTVILKKDGYEVGRKIINVTRKSSVQETFIAMTKKNDPAVLDVRSDADPAAAGAQVWVDGQQVGTIPVQVNVGAGRHLVEIKKPDHDTFSSWIEVKEGERTTINPMLKGQARGSILVNADVPDAEVVLDGKALDDKTPTLVSNVLEGPHVLEVRKPPAAPWKQSVEVVRNQTLKVTAQLKGGDKPVVDAPALGDGSIRVVSAEPEAMVYIDGEKLGTAPQEKKVSSGEHIVVVEKKGFARFQTKVTVSGGGTESVTARLEMVGGARFVSTPSGAQVFVDGKLVGVTPMTDERIAVGAHVVTVKKKGFNDWEGPLNVEVGQPGVVNATLETYSEKSAAELQVEQRGLSAFGAQAMPRGRSLFAFGSGYPYFADMRFVVGAPKLAGKIGLDAGLTLQMYAAQMQAAVLGRVTFVDVSPFSLGAFVETGGGGALFDARSKRNTYFMNAGGAVSLTGLGAVTLTGRAYLNMYSDRHCPKLLANGNFESKSSATDLCTNFRDDRLNAEDRERIEELVGDGNEFFTRDNNVRLMTSIIVEVAFQQHWSLWGMIDFVPRLDERAAFTDVINGILLEDDLRMYPRGGLSYKF